MKKQSFFRGTRGITLIALVLTIIVLLILAGVALSLVLGENGITERAVNAGKTQNIAGAKEKVELDVANYASEFYQAQYINNEGVNSIQDYVLGKLNPADYAPDYVLTKNTSAKTVTLTSNIGSDRTTATGVIDTDGKVTWGAVAITSAGGNGGSSQANANLQSLEAYFIGHDVWSLIDWDSYPRVCIVNDDFARANEIVCLCDSDSSPKVADLFMYDSQYFHVVSYASQDTESGDWGAIGRSIELIEFDETPLDDWIGESELLAKCGEPTWNDDVFCVCEYEGNTYEVYWQMDSDWNWTILGIRLQSGLLIDKSELKFEKKENNPSAQTLTATARGISDDVEWTIANRNVATISSNTGDTGTVTGDTITVTPVADGITTITVTCGDITKECTIGVGAGKWRWYNYFDLETATMTEYDFLYGMTWKEWCDSDYNVDGFSYWDLGPSDCGVGEPDGLTVCYGNQEYSTIYVRPDELISDSINYFRSR